MEDVLSGNVVAGKLVIAACERQRRDLARQNTDEFPYCFDEQEANDVCQFFPLALRHSKGRYADLPFELEPWQIFNNWVLFGWKRCADHTRRFRKAMRSYARKNGKSTECAGIGLYGITCDGEPGAEVYVSATKKEQAGCVFTEAERMRRKSPSLSRVTKNHVNNIFVDSTDSFFRPTSSDKPLDGPNPHIVIFDELHAWREVHRKYYDTMTTGGASRTQPLQITITTAGNDQSLIWLEEYNYCKSVVLGEFEDETVYVYIAEIDDDDDPLDEACWIKANPNLGVSVSIEYMRQQAKDARNKPSFFKVFVAKHCNKITSSKQSAFNMENWDACAGEIGDWGSADAIGAGVDLGGRDDLAASGLVARWPYGEIEVENDKGETEIQTVWRYEGRVRVYIAEDSERDLTKQPFATWVHTGQLIVCKHPIARLQADLIADCQDLGVSTVAYDPYNAQQLSESLESQGLTTARMAQNYSMFNEPIGDLLEAIKAGRFLHDGSPLLRWACKNAVTVVDRQLRVMYDKAASSEKIDPAVALTMAFRICSLAKSRPTGALYI